MNNSPYWNAASGVPFAFSFLASVPLSTPQDTGQSTPLSLVVSIRLPYESGNASSQIYVNSALTGDPVVDNYRPRTALGKKLLALRRAYIENGGLLLNDAEFEAELRHRRGGINA